MDTIPKDFSKLSHEQVMYFAKLGFEAYWTFFYTTMKGKAIDFTIQHLGKAVVEMQKVINAQNQELYEKHKAHCSKDI